ncbi:hypothetical protein PAXRUDRAFT_178517 [Paxillus rubicundulus Ve08.2h10]|uniref:GAG-pre-integrase domain-containing protein n=1 Tax=Paxillus rubicundulus Ve08.2h10 TaxID=930991 RepID=A0A0D0D0T7_9AGAM|nr:hypothetical protein PAXRUDRAFT_178517 [Paxillus rubicundulus Ve08.2h10]
MFLPTCCPNPRPVGETPLQLTLELLSTWSHTNPALFSTMSGKKYEIILTNVLLILGFCISHIPINCLSTTGLSTAFPASSSTCYVQKGRTPVLTGTHQQGPYHANVIPEYPKEVVHAAVDINLLHQCMGHIFIMHIKHMVKQGQLWGIDVLTRTPSFCEACILRKMKKLPFELLEEPCTT